jgi:hypothetical protein
VLRSVCRKVHLLVIGVKPHIVLEPTAGLARVVASGGDGLWGCGGCFTTVVDGIHTYSPWRVLSHLQVVAVANLCPPPVLLEVADGVGVEQQLIATVHVAAQTHVNTGGVSQLRIDESCSRVSAPDGSKSKEAT